MKVTWKDLKGWFDFPSIYDRAIETAPRGATLVEVGVAYGRSINYMATQSKLADKALKIVGVDLFMGSVKEKPGTYAKDMFDQFVHGVHACGNNDVIRTLLGDSADSAKNFKDKSCHLVFIDASHTYDEVKRDLIAWLPKVSRGGIFAGHDIDAEGVRKAVNEVLGKEGVDWIIEGRSWVMA